MKQHILSGRKLLYKIQHYIGMTEKEFRMFFLISVLLLLGSAVRYANFYDETSGNPDFVAFDAEFRRLTDRADSLSRIDLLAAEAKIAALPEFQPQPDTGIELNAATAQELQKLPRIGPSLAASIIKTRNQLGGFLIVDDLLLVSGIGSKTLEKLRPLIRVESRINSSPENP